MYQTYDCARIGVFNIGEACKSIDVTKDSKYLLASMTVYGFGIYTTHDGELKVKIEVPGIMCKYVEFALGDKKFLVLYDHEGKSYVRIYDFESALRGENKPEKEIQGPEDHFINQASWGPLNETIYIATDKGRMVLHDIDSGKARVT